MFFRKSLSFGKSFSFEITCLLSCEICFSGLLKMLCELPIAEEIKWHLGPPRMVILVVSLGGECLTGAQVTGLAVEGLCRIQGNAALISVSLCISALSHPCYLLVKA